MRDDYGLFPPPKSNDYVVWVAGLVGMVLGAALALVGAWLLTVLVIGLGLPV